jgi:hypothetical protein
MIQCGIFGFSLYQKEDFENAKGVIRIRISKKNWQHNGQKDKQRSTKHTHKTKDQVTRITSPLIYIFDPSPLLQSTKNKLSAIKMLKY